MKKILALFLAAAALPSIAVAQEEEEATPIEMTWDGYYRFRYRYTHESQRGKRDSQLFPATSDNHEFADQRFMVNMDMKVLEDVHIKGQFRLLDNFAWGDNTSGQILDFNPDDSANQILGRGNQTSYDDTFRVERIWAEVTTKFGRFDFGRMASDWGMGLFANGGNKLDWLWEGQGDDFGDTVDRVRYILFFGEDQKAEGAAYRKGMMIAPLYTRVSTNNRDFTTDNVDEFVLALMYSGDNFQVGTYDGYRHQDSTDSSAWFFDVYAAYDQDFGGWGLKAETEAFYLRGNIGADSQAGSIRGIRAEGFNWAMRLHATFGDQESMTYGVRMDMGVSTGPKRRDLLNTGVTTPGGGTFESPRAIGSVPFDSDFDVDMILFEQYVGAVSNAFYAKVTGHIDFYNLLMDDDKLTAYLSLMYARSLTDTFIRGRRDESGTLVITDGTGGAVLGQPTVTVGSIRGGMGYDSIARRYGHKDLGLEMNYGVGYEWKQFSLEVEMGLLFTGKAFDLGRDPLSNGDSLAILDHINPGTANAIIGNNAAGFIGGNNFTKQDSREVIFSTSIQAAVRF